MTERRTDEPEKSVIGLNVLVLPDADTSDKAMSLSLAIAESCNARFALDGVNFVPHLTLYLTEYPDSAIPAIEDVLADSIIRNSPLTIRMKGFSAVSGFIFWDAETSDELYRLHESTLSELAPLREVKDSYIDLPGLTEGQREGLANFGYALALKEYKPHITLTRLEEEGDAETVLKSLLSVVDSEFAVSTLVLARAGVEGTCSKSGIIRRFELGKAN